MATRKPLEDITTIDGLEAWLDIQAPYDVASIKEDLLNHVASIISLERNDSYREGLWDAECTRDCCYA